MRGTESYNGIRSHGNGIRLVLNLGCEELHAMCHLFYAADFTDKRPLEGVHIQVD